MYFITFDQLIHTTEHVATVLNQCENIVPIIVKRFRLPLTMFWSPQLHSFVCVAHKVQVVLRINLNRV